MSSSMQSAYGCAWNDFTSAGAMKQLLDCAEYVD